MLRKDPARLDLKVGQSNGRISGSMSSSGLTASSYHYIRPEDVYSGMSVENT